jgi:predicted metalloendopeptidase
LLQAEVEDQDEESLAEQYRGTPPLRTKKKKQLHRYSHEISEQVGPKYNQNYFYQKLCRKYNHLC